MKQSQDGTSHTRALAEKPLYAVVAKGDLHAAEAEPTRQARIRAAAYALYEARGHGHGHDVEDWLAAEAAVRVGHD